jgi:hypothetical protein
MHVALEIHPTGPGLLCAAAAVAAGAPLFSDALRALRLRRTLASLRAAKLEDAPSGFVHLSGRVALESPLFAPLSGRRCAAFGLEVRTSGAAALRSIEDRRHFWLIDGARSARVMSEPARWELGVSAERDVAHGDTLSEHLTALLEGVPEAVWARGAGATLHLVERALLAGTECHVIGFARHARATEAESESEWVRTGTDDVALPAGTNAGQAAGIDTLAEPELCIGSGEPFDFVLVSDRPPDLRQLGVPAWRLAGLVAGPALSLAGLSYLAGALDTLRALGNL